MTLQEFYDAVERHDWFYEMSDDHRVWVNGEAARARLENEASTDFRKREILDAFTKHHYSGEPWSTTKAPKPERPL